MGRILIWRKVVSFVTVLTAFTALSTAAKQKIVLLKLDDVHYGDSTDVVPPRWNKVVDFINDNGLKANLGIIGYSLAEERPAYFRWIKDVASKGNIEFWAHGYRNRLSMDEQGEFEQDFPGQLRALQLTDSLAEANLGLKLQAWGRHWTNTNELTDSALAQIPNIRLVFGHPSERRYFKGVVIPFNLEMEYPFHNPDFGKSLENYEGKWSGLDCFYLQGHPNSWDDRRWEEFKKIIAFLKSENVRFVTISEFLSLTR